MQQVGQAHWIALLRLWLLHDYLVDERGLIRVGPGSAERDYTRLAWSGRRGAAVEGGGARVGHHAATGAAPRVAVVPSDLPLERVCGFEAPC